MWPGELLEVGLPRSRDLLAPRQPAGDARNGRGGAVFAGWKLASANAVAGSPSADGSRAKFETIWASSLCGRRVSFGLTKSIDNRILKLRTCAFGAGCVSDRAPAGSSQVQFARTSRSGEHRPTGRHTRNLSIQPNQAALQRRAEPQPPASVLREWNITLTTARWTTPLPSRREKALAASLDRRFEPLRPSSAASSAPRRTLEGFE